MLNLVAPINFRSYGVCGLNILKSLTKLTDVSLTPLGQIEAEPQNHPLIKKAIERPFNVGAPSIRLFHQFSLAEHVSPKLRVGWPIFELDEFNRLEIHHLESQDRLFVCSSWAKKVIEDNNIEVPCDVVPLGVDRGIFNERLNKPHPTKTIFFHCGKIEIRKGHDILCEVFNEAFTRHDDVELWISWFNPFMTPEEVQQWERTYQFSDLGSKIKFLPWTATQADLLKVMGQADCGIWLSRAEGWNLPLLEFLSTGKPVISTYFSGETEFLDDSNSMRICPKETEPAFDGKWFLGKYGNWAKLGSDEKEQAVTYMRRVYLAKKENNVSILSNNNGIETAKKFSWDNAARRVLECVDEGRFT